MPTLQERILLLFRRSPSWTGRRISQALTVPHIMVLDQVRTMERKRWFNTRGHAGDLAVDITKEGRAALAALLENGTR